MSLRNRNAIFIFIAVLAGALFSGCTDISQNDKEPPSTPRTYETPTATNFAAPVEIIPDTGWNIL